MEFITKCVLIRGGICYILFKYVMEKSLYRGYSEQKGA